MSGHDPKKVILHIGLQKTATTYFQENVWPTLKTYTYLTRPFTQHNHAFNQLQYADDSLYSKDLVIKELSKINAENLLISDESLSGKSVIFSYINRSLIAERLKEIFPHAKILLFIRDQKDMLRSYYSSYVKMLYGTKKFKEFIWRPGREYTFEDFKKQPRKYDLTTLYFNNNDFYLHLDCFKYSSLINCFRKYFDDMHIFLYEEFENNSMDILKRIEEIVDEKLNIQSKNKVNISLSSRDLEKVRKANILSTCTTNRYAKRIAQWGMRLFPESVQDLKIEVSDIVEDYYQEDNKLLKNSLPDLPWDHYPDKYN